MCGIAGWVTVQASSTTAPVRLQAMGTAMAHRGPDDAGSQQWADAGLAFQRLALLDIPGGAQPATDATGRYWTMMNGELYNHRELRAQLRDRGHTPPGTGDASLLPYLFQVWGPQMVHRLRGMFALAVFDRQANELLLARDGFGIKPLYWAEEGGRLLFASEISALRAASDTRRDVQLQAVSHYLSFGYVPDPLTMWHGIHTLPPGHALLVKDQKVRIERWWSPQLAPTASHRGSDLLDVLADRLQDSVAAHLDADVPVGAYLSSGVDSSLLVSLASAQQPVRTFSIGFEGASDSLDELAQARSLAHSLGTQHHDQVVGMAEYWQHLPDIVRSQEQPLTDPSAPALWFLARAASAQVKAVLSGEGADELFAGYPIYQEPRALRPVSALPAAWQSGLGRLARRLPEGRRGRGYLTRATTPLERRFLGSVPLFSEDAREELLATPREDVYTGWDRLRAVYARTGHLDDVSRMQAATLETWLPASILMKADKMSMAHSLEVRVPYLDREVFAVARELPIALRVSRQATKIALRRVAERHLPREVAWRPKLGFPVPFRQWLDGPFGGHARALFEACDDPLLDYRAVQTVLDGADRPGQQRRVWGLMVYLLWREIQAP